MTEKREEINHAIAKLIYEMYDIKVDKLGITRFDSKIKRRSRIFTRSGDPIDLKNYNQKAKKNDLDFLCNKVLSRSSLVVKYIKDNYPLTLVTQKDATSRLYIGYGHRFGVKPNQNIMPADAIQILRKDLDAAEDYLKANLTQNINQEMYDALVCLTFDICDAVQPVIDLVNKGSYAEAGLLILKFNTYIDDNGNIKAHQTITRRRKTEKQIFLLGADKMPKKTNT